MEVIYASILIQVEQLMRRNAQVRMPGAEVYTTPQKLYNF